jgi:hypothetical protein
MENEGVVAFVSARRKKFKGVRRTRVLCKVFAQLRNQRASLFVLPQA